MNKCKHCGHDHKDHNPCRVLSTGNYKGMEPCGCKEFVEPEDLPVCPGCGEVVSYSHSFALLNPTLPYLFVCVWCTNCKHILTSQVTIALQPAQATPGKSNIHVPGGPLG